MRIEEKLDGYVYCAMDVDRGVCKIGMSESERSRVKSLSTGYPGKLTSEVVKVSDRREAENYLHRRFCERRIQGEWFEGVSFEEFFSALHEYKSKKEKQHLNSIKFFEFLYGTRFECINGVPMKKKDKLSRLHARVFMFVGYGFADHALLVERCEQAFKNLFAENAIITIVYPDFKAQSLSYVNKLRDIEYEHFFPYYNYGMCSTNNDYLPNCLNRIETCYAALFFCTKEHSKITQMKNRCIARGIKHKIIVSELTTKFKKKR